MVVENENAPWSALGFSNANQGAVAIEAKTATYGAETLGEVLLL
jgi:hypothetical protein